MEPPPQVWQKGYCITKTDQYMGVRRVEDSYLEVLQPLVHSYFLLMQIEHDVILIFVLFSRHKSSNHRRFQS